MRNQTKRERQDYILNFILFGEYVGYDSQFYKFAEEAKKRNKLLNDVSINVLAFECSNIYRYCCSFMTLDEIETSYVDWENFDFMNNLEVDDDF